MKLKNPYTPVHRHFALSKTYREWEKVVFAPYPFPNTEKKEKKNEEK